MNSYQSTRERVDRDPHEWRRPLAYIHSSGGEPIPPETIVHMAELFDLSIPSEDLETLSVALRDQLDSITRLQALDLEGVAPVHRFDARWHD